MSPIRSLSHQTIPCFIVPTSLVTPHVASATIEGKRRIFRCGAGPDGRPSSTERSRSTLINPEVWTRRQEGSQHDRGKEIRIGLIGFGWMGQAHSRSYRNIPVYFPETGIRPRLVAVADTADRPAPTRRRQLRLREHLHGDWREVIERTDIDVVDITAPNAMHEQLATAAAPRRASTSSARSRSASSRGPRPLSRPPPGPPVS